MYFDMNYLFKVYYIIITGKMSKTKLSWKKKMFRSQRK